MSMAVSPVPDLGAVTCGLPMRDRQVRMPPKEARAHRVRAKLPPKCRVHSIGMTIKFMRLIGRIKTTTKQKQKGSVPIQIEHDVPPLSGAPILHTYNALWNTFEEDISNVYCCCNGMPRLAERAAILCFGVLMYDKKAELCQRLDHRVFHPVHGSGGSRSYPKTVPRILLLRKAN